METDKLRQTDRHTQYSYHEGNDVVGIERRLATKELIQDNTQRPEINSVIVRLFLHEFWRHVQRGALDRCQRQRLLGERAREAEVAQLELAVRSNENILWFHVAVDDFVRVQVVQR